MGYTYPVRHQTGTLTTEQLHLLLKNPRLIARQVASLTNEKFLADYLLSGRYDAAGGGVYYETETADLYTGTDPEAIEPAGDYPLIQLDEGVPSAARTVKFGQGSVITDEKISREGNQYVQKALMRVGNQMVRYVDTVAWGVIASRVSSTSAATSDGVGAWTTAGNVLGHLMMVREARAELATGLDLDTVVLPSAKWAKLVGMLVDDGALPREQGNIALSGTAPVSAFGMTWLTSPHITGTDPWLFDTAQLGGMADEKLLSEEFAAAGQTGVEASTTRIADNDSYLVRGRRVTVPIVTEPQAGVKLTGTGL
ncbi:phage major capsid protein [Gulosibacter molinativorax]|uniref:phage major capsid protein n=1 Tax=Gulosibacter molinativorax TaxID=256821 RepID=UPI00223F8588|nr:hypothetical protein [Gulosibacter molinativorax]QUY63346.1 Hypotetical protein [Gulosibacter molinativorax]